MLIGCPDKIAFLIERVPEWETESFVNGLFFVFVNGILYPPSLRTATLNSELFSLLNDNSPLIVPAADEMLYQLSSDDLFIYLNEITFPTDCDQDNDYNFLVPFHELNDAGYCIFLISSAERARFLVGKWNAGSGQYDWVDEVEIGMNELVDLRTQLQEFYNDNCVR